MLDAINLGYAKGEVEPDKELGCNVDNILIPLQKIQSRTFYGHFNAISSSEPVSSFRLKRLFNLTLNCIRYPALPLVHNGGSIEPLPRENHFPTRIV